MDIIKRFLEWITLKEKLHKSTSEGFLGVPLSTKIKTGTWYVKIKHKEVNSVAMLSQVRVISSKRLLQKFGELDKQDQENIKLGFCGLYLGKKFVPPEGGVVGKSQI